MQNTQSLVQSLGDASREMVKGWSPGRSLIKTIRDYQGMSPWNPLRKLAVLRHRFWSAVSGADIPLNSNIGLGLWIPHPNGVVIHPRATIGVNCIFQQGVTIGYAKGGVPTIGNGVELGAGAKVIGGVTVGDCAVIGANAVVTRDVPANCVAVGIPARVIGQAQ